MSRGVATGKPPTLGVGVQLQDSGLCNSGLSLACFLHHACSVVGATRLLTSVDRALRKLGAITVRAYAVTAQYDNISAILQSAGSNLLQVMRITGVVRNPG